MNAPISQPSPPRTVPLRVDAEFVLHRARHLSGLCLDRSVHLAGIVDNAARAAIAAVATLVDGDAEFVLSLPAMAARDALAALPGLAARCAPGGTLVLTEALADGRADPRLRTALEQRFRHVTSLQQRGLSGSVITPKHHAFARVLPLAAPSAALSGFLIHVCAEVAPTLPGPALHETGGKAGWIPPAAAPVSAVIAASPLPMSGITPTQADLRARAVALAERLVRQSEHMRVQAEQIDLLRAGQAVEQPTTRHRRQHSRHPWPLADNPDADPASLDLYERRVDDPVLLEARRGDAFLQRFDLLGPAPDFTGAIAAINALARPDRSAPDVTVVMPVHGQFAYTLNALHSLASLPDQTRFTTIVVDDASTDETRRMLPRIKTIRALRQNRNAGFVASCNLAASQATTRFVLFLNNDTRVVPGWLDTLVESFTWFPNAGLVGSKLLYPDGSLQEAGCILWRDASAWNDGRNDDPNRPEYSCARQVDYISGCSIMLPTELWNSLGGFDPMFSPAYCEDADLALRVRASGLEVWFQPQSRVVHYEGRTSGTDLAQGVKAFQVINARKLYLRWRDALAHHHTNGDTPQRERERNVHRRALVIDATAPTPTQDAGSVTTVLTLRLFQRLGFKAFYVPQDNFLFQPDHVTNLQREGVEVTYAPYNTSIASYLRAHGAAFDAVLVFRVTVLEKVIDDLRQHAPQAPILFHNMDLHFLRMERQAQADNDADALARAAAMRVRELDLIRRVDCTITHSTFERDLLARLAPEAPVVVWPFMFEFHGTEVGFAARKDFCFLGGYGHWPNVDAVIFMAEQVMPLIRAELPDARLIIAGARPGPEVLRLAGDHIVVTGQIEDLREVFDTVRVFACSLRIGAGTKGKISTAMAYGLPVVSTPCGAEGMSLIDGEDVLIAETAAEFAQACLRLHRDPALWGQLSEAGQRLVQAKHSLAMGEQVLDQAIETALRHKLDLRA